ncbi:hypothetical protein ACPCK2_06095 [Streptomyces pseudogriseolus]|uniref:hypothetical protein n=1 Tax=Streptomyces pseudogriseolus TaxID=36817 RepID=UPI003FA29E44
MPPGSAAAGAPQDAVRTAEPGRRPPSARPRSARSGPRRPLATLLVRRRQCVRRLLEGDYGGDGKDDIVTFTHNDLADVYENVSNGRDGFTNGREWHDFFGLVGETTL